MSRPKKKTEASLFDGFFQIDEAFHVARSLPLRAWFFFYAGSFPFVLGFLYFWSEMSQGAQGKEILPVASLGLTLLYGWMKAWQSAFGAEVWASASRRPPKRRAWGETVRMALYQCILQPVGLVLLPVSVILMFPFAWVYAFFQNACVIPLEEKGSLKELTKRSWEMAKLWPKQNHLSIWLLSPVLMILTVLLIGFSVFALRILSEQNRAIFFAGFGFYLVVSVIMAGLCNPFGVVVALNIGFAIFGGPMLLKILFDIETPFTMGHGSLLHSTFFVITSGLTYLCLDPLVKVVYVLRCYHGDSLQSGADLLAELKAIREGEK